MAFPDTGETTGFRALAAAAAGPRNVGLAGSFSRRRQAAYAALGEVRHEAVRKQVARKTTWTAIIGAGILALSPAAFAADTDVSEVFEVPCRGVLITSVDGSTVRVLTNRTDYPDGSQHFVRNIKFSKNTPAVGDDGNTYYLTGWVHWVRDYADSLFSGWANYNLTITDATGAAFGTFDGRTDFEPDGEITWVPGTCMS